MVVKGEDSCQEMGGSNSATGYCMDIFHINLLLKWNCLLEKMLRWPSFKKSVPNLTPEVRSLNQVFKIVGTPGR